MQQGYGLTEASPVTHCTPLSDPLNPGAIGKLLPNTQGRMVDVETGRDAGRVPRARCGCAVRR